jgi:hypothetical protein
MGLDLRMLDNDVLPASLVEHDTPMLRIQRFGDRAYEVTPTRNASATSRASSARGA